MEATGNKYRVIIGVLYQNMFSVGSGFLGLAAYYVRDWRTVQLIAGVPMFIPLILHWYFTHEDENVLRLKCKINHL